MTFAIHQRREFYLLDQQARETKHQVEYKRHVHTRLHNLQLPLQQRTLLITDVTRLQPFTAGGDSFRENIETLLSYNVHTDGVTTRLSLH